MDLGKTGFRDGTWRCLNLDRPWNGMSRFAGEMAGPAGAAWASALFGSVSVPHSAAAMASACSLDQLNGAQRLLHQRQ
jgi:hypothetical protein